jgi:hypothetical protein
MEFNLQILADDGKKTTTGNYIVKIKYDPPVFRNSGLQDMRIAVGTSQN